MDMNSPLGKQILALVRNADYAHAGEEEAIDLVFKGIGKDPKRLLLDVGCGRGGTAGYVQHNGWGRVTGVDIDSESIDYARKAYADIEFVAADAMELAGRISRQFDMVYLFNVFYALPDHKRALGQLKSLVRQGGQIIIFDYLLKPKDRSGFPFKEWNPLDLSVVDGLFSGAGLKIVRTDDISPMYRKWYGKLNSRIDDMKGRIIALAGEEWFEYVRSFYGKILDSIEKNVLGGAIVYAEGR